MKKFLLFFFLIASQLQAFDAPVASFVSNLSMKVLDVSNSFQKLEIRVATTATESAQYDLNLKFFNPQLGVNASFPIQVQIKIDGSVVATNDTFLTSNEADIQTLTNVVTINDASVIEVFAKQSENHPLSLNAYMWLVKH